MEVQTPSMTCRSGFRNFRSAISWRGRPYTAAFSALTFAQRALAAAAIFALEAALIFLRFFAVSGSASSTGVSAVLTRAHLAFWAAIFLARPAALNLYFFRVLTGSDAAAVGISRAFGEPFPSSRFASWAFRASICSWIAPARLSWADVSDVKLLMRIDY